MTQKTLLLTNCGHSEMPLIFAARRLGWRIITTGLTRDAVGHRLADETVLGDFADKEFIYHLAKEKNVDAIVSGCEDDAYISAAYACDKLGFPGHDSYETACIIHNKLRFREIMHEVGVPTPKFSVCRSFAEAKVACEEIGFPLLVKAVDLNSGRGITICRNMDTLEKAYRQAEESTRQPDILLEKFVEGTRHAVNVIFQSQKVAQSFFDDEQYYLNPYLVAGASSPSGLSHYTMAQVLRDLEKIAERLALVDGMFHVQFIAQPDGTAILIDPCRRIPGGLYLLLAEYAGGFPCAEAAVRCETGQGGWQDLERTRHRFIAREYIMTDRAGTVERVTIDEPIMSHMVDRFIWAKRGDVVEDPMTYKAGIVFLEFENYREMQETLRNFYSMVRVEFR